MFALPIRPGLVYVRSKDDRKKELRHAASPKHHEAHHHHLHADFSGTSPDTKSFLVPSNLRTATSADVSEEQERPSEELAVTGSEEAVPEQLAQPALGIGTFVQPASETLAVS